MKVFRSVGVFCPDTCGTVVPNVKILAFLTQRFIDKKKLRCINAKLKCVTRTAWKQPAPREKAKKVQVCENFVYPN